MVITFFLTSTGMLLPASPLVSRAQLMAVQLATPLLLLSADMRAVGAVPAALCRPSSSAPLGRFWAHFSACSCSAVRSRPRSAPTASRRAWHWRRRISAAG